MKSCSSLWIVAPITRAVDDKTAKSLLGDTFKRQLKFDGTYSAVTFICSKTDDISVIEAAESLDIDEVSASWTEAEALQESIQPLEVKLSIWREAKASNGYARDECDAKLDTWTKLEGQLKGGETVYAPSDMSKKRKRQSISSGSGTDSDSENGSD